MFRSFTKIILAGLAALPATAAFPGHGVGTGGDYIRASFFSMGQAVVQYLDESDEGIALRDRHGLNTEQLLKVLDINVVEVQDGILVDNLGSEVDALGQKDKIVLSRNRWAAHLENDRDVYFLVFHEMLRAIEVNDDNYVISKAVQPFPTSRKVMTRLTSLYPILGQTPLDSIVAVDKIAVTGTGCSDQLTSTFSDLDLERNVLSVGFRRFDIPLLMSLSGMKSCTVTIPVKAPVGKRLIVSQLDFSAKIVLSAGASATIATDAVFGASGLAPRNKSITATAPTQGRLFLRTVSSAASTCDGSGQLLKVKVAGSAQKPASVEQLNMLSADHMAVSFVVEDCVRRK